MTTTAPTTTPTSKKPIKWSSWICVFFPISVELEFVYVKQSFFKMECRIHENTAYAYNIYGSCFATVDVICHQNVWHLIACVCTWNNNIIEDWWCQEISINFIYVLSATTGVKWMKMRERFSSNLQIKTPPETNIHNWFAWSKMESIRIDSFGDFFRFIRFYFHGVTAQKWKRTRNWLAPYAKSNRAFYNACTPYTHTHNLFRVANSYLFANLYYTTYYTFSKFTHTLTWALTYRRYIIMCMKRISYGYRSSLILCTFYHEAIRVSSKMIKKWEKLLLEKFRCKGFKLRSLPLSRSRSRSHSRFRSCSLTLCCVLLPMSLLPRCWSYFLLLLCVPFCSISCFFLPRSLSLSLVRPLPKIHFIRCAHRDISISSHFPWFLCELFDGVRIGGNDNGGGNDTRRLCEDGVGDGVYFDL